MPVVAHASVGFVWVWSRMEVFSPLMVLVTPAGVVSLPVSVYMTCVSSNRKKYVSSFLATGVSLPLLTAFVYLVPAKLDGACCFPPLSLSE